MGHGETVAEAVDAAKIAGEDNPVLVKMPLPNVGIAAHIS
jgi:transaldolase